MVQNASVTPPRLESLDVLRGLTIAGMVLVTDPGSYEHAFAQLLHAQWNGPTLADTIFPTFLFAVGVSLTLSFAARLGRGARVGALAAHVLRRTLWLVALGLVINWVADISLAHLRLPGILQRIGVCYLLVGLVYLLLQREGLSRRIRLAILLGCWAASLGLYWALLRFYPTPGFGAGRLDPLGTLPAVVDRAVFTVPHMFRYGVQTPGYGITFDPEGVLSTLGALATVLTGVLAGEELRHGRDRARQCATLATAGTVLWLLSLVWNRTLPLNKQIYTPSFALWSSGLALLVFAALLWWVDVRGHRRGWTPALIFGTNAIFAFAVSQLVTRFFYTVTIRNGTRLLSLYSTVYEHLLAPWLPLKVASLVWAVVVVLLNLLIVWPLYRRRIFLRL